MLLLWSSAKAVETVQHVKMNAAFESTSIMACMLPIILACMIVLITVVVWKMRDHPKRCVTRTVGVNTDPSLMPQQVQQQPQKKHKQTQSQCTYTRHHAQPRFTPLPEASAGTWGAE